MRGGGLAWRRRRRVKMEDEEVAESWEEAADSGSNPNDYDMQSLPSGTQLLVNFHLEKHYGQEIDRRLEKKLKITQKERKSKSPPKVPIVIQDDSLPSGPPPQIRILKRPTTNGVLSNPNSVSRPAFPVKSLAQREAEYAEARKRILGSASPEEEQEKPILDRPTRISQPEDSRQPNNVIRQPLGPDGSQGFRQRR
ncbi:SUZ domain-containing protein 1 isoform X2 [Chelonia mydas]|uniref:SUZ domain-containing protein 1 isoform X2 n=1 Tax=Chelonia mydas TaxID=8469 RepID=UPI0018A1BF1B|nr:SUZ domain-containing protein 1 isoform X2 [Chelonia mydas]